MNGPLRIIKMAELVLEQVKRPLSAYEIWEEGKKLGLADKVKHTGKTPWASLGAQIYVDIRDNPNTLFYQPSKRPAKFYLKIYQKEGIIIDTSEKGLQEREKSPNFLERDLHPLLCRFVNLNPHFKCQVKTVYHELSTNPKKGYNEWLHPDIVGVYFPFEDYRDVTLKIQKSLSLSSIKLFSFELKRDLNFGNLRLSYFQAVSNSSWANEGYLVVLKMDNDPQLLEEIQRLNNSFGIGLIKLNPENVDESEIIFQSRVNNEFDWDTIDRLVENNSNFRDFMQDVVEDIQLGKIKGTYDPFMNDDELVSFVKEKHII